MNKLEDKIKKSIKNKKPKSGNYFLFQTTAREIAIAILWFICVGLLGTIIYLLQYFPWRIFVLPNFFLRGVVGLPWELFALASLLIVALYFLTKSISTLYRNKNVLIIALTISLIGGYFIAESSGLNEIIAGTGPIKPLYQRRGRLVAPERLPAIAGEIISVDDNSIEIIDEQGFTWTVRIDKNTRISGPTTTGRRIIVLGEKDGRTINALEIRGFNGQRGLKKPQGPLRPPTMY